MMHVLLPQSLSHSKDFSQLQSYLKQVSCHSILKPSLNLNVFLEKKILARNELNLFSQFIRMCVLVFGLFVPSVLVLLL